MLVCYHTTRLHDLPDVNLTLCVAATGNVGVGGRGAG